MLWDENVVKMLCTWKTTTLIPVKLHVLFPLAFEGDTPMCGCWNTLTLRSHIQMPPGVGEASADSLTFRCRRPICLKIVGAVMNADGGCQATVSQAGGSQIASRQQL